jgi:hypothetical protein
MNSRVLDVLALSCLALMLTGCANLAISVQWGETNIGNTPSGPKLTAFIDVTNVGMSTCHPPTDDAEFVVGGYFKGLGLIKATSVGAFPTKIEPGETRSFVLQTHSKGAAEPDWQKVIYDGYVDFYVSSQAPGQPDLSAAVRPACKGETDLANNNAHSVEKVITNP